FGGGTLSHDVHISAQKQKTLPLVETGSPAPLGPLKPRTLFLLGILLFESLHTPFGVHDLLRARKEGVAVGTDVHMDVPHRGSGLKLRAAGALDHRLGVRGMNAFLHEDSFYRFIDCRNS